MPTDSIQWLSQFVICKITWRSIFFPHTQIHFHRYSDNTVDLPFGQEVAVMDKLDKKEMEQTSFTPGSIHAEEVREFWKTNLKAGMWVMDTLRTGYVIPFEKFPEAYEEPNNASALKDLDFVYKAVSDLKEIGIVKFVDYKPHCVSPFTISIKMGRDGQKKKRLCWDGSRCVNLCIKKQKVTLSHLQRALELTKDQDYQITYDLKAAYHHIRIHSSQTKFLGAAIPKPNGGTQYLLFLFLPFGLSSAVHCITKIFKPVNAYLHESGIRHSIYLDDGRVTSQKFRQKNIECLSMTSYERPNSLLRKTNPMEKERPIRSKNIWDS